MATARLLRASKPVGHVPSSGASSSSFSTVKCTGGSLGLAGGEKVGSVDNHGDNRKTMAGVSVRASPASSSSERLIIAKPPAQQGIELLGLLSTVVRSFLLMLRPPAILEPKTSKLQVQKLIEKAIIDCRFFTLFAVAGSLLGSVLCFVEGCFLILESYFQYFSSLNRISTQGHMMHQLIEAIDMFLVGTALLIFGVGLHVMFVGTKESKDEGVWLPGSNLFGLFSLKSLPTWVEMQSVSQAKSKIGHAVMLILQVGLLEKFKSIPLVTSLDLACFAGAVLASSAGIFLLSKLSIRGITEDR
ncbi:hypothetical protein Tsubulata_023567 [Turnera subulata]|uniref:Uncharacterized protein n=1 Tax=Turnera subulata TaxID=218843 RepID=A0A9Q0G0P8_9ROSI|nr:hypothetical protein Tsubulata_023567 [Turnera subulata]